MKTSLFRLLRVMATLVLAASFYTSCVSAPQQSRGSLSNAMDRARDDNGADRSVPDNDRNLPPGTYPDPNERFPEPPSANSPDNRDPGNSDHGPADPVSSIPVEPVRVWLGLRGANATGPDHEIKTLWDGDVVIRGDVTPHIEIALYAGMKVANPVSGTDLDASVKDALLFFKAGVEGAYMFFPEWRIFSPYVFAGAGGFTMFWSFQNPLTAGEDIITGDNIGGMLLTVGAGIYPLNLESFRLGINIIPETYLYGPVTQQGFDNDYFSVFNTMKISIEVSFRF